MRRVVIALGIASLACAPAGPEGESIHIADESALIIWDAASKTQHFIRRASFETKAKDFGFLVPTPTLPVLAEAEDEVFSRLAFITRPTLSMVKSERGTEKSIPAPASAPRVVVLATATVAGMDAAVLESNDARALDGWLKENGYQSSPALVEWYRPYREELEDHRVQDRNRRRPERVHEGGAHVVSH